MGAVRRIAVSVPEDLARELDGAVESGRYESIDDAVEDALQAWRGEQVDLDADALRQLYEEGLASGEPIEGGFDAEDIKRRGRERLDAQNRSAA